MAEERSIQPKLSLFLSLGEVLNSQIPAAGLRVSETARASATRWRRKRPPPQAKYIFVISAKRSIRVRAFRTHSWILVAPFFTGLSMSRKGQCERSVADE